MAAEGEHGAAVACHSVPLQACRRRLLLASVLWLPLSLLLLCMLLVVRFLPLLDLLFLRLLPLLLLLPPWVLLQQGRQVQHLAQVHRPHHHLTRTHFPVSASTGTQDSEVECGTLQILKLGQEGRMPSTCGTRQAEAPNRAAGQATALAFPFAKPALPYFVFFNFLSR